MAANKPTAVHYTLIVFVMLTIIWGVVAYLFYKDLAETQQKLTKATKEASDGTTALRNQGEEIQSLKKLIGREGEIGKETDPTTVLGGAYAVINAQGVQVEDKNLIDTILVLRSRIDELEKKHTQALTDLDDRDTERRNQSSTMQNTITEHENARRTASTNLANVQTSLNEQVGALEGQINSNKVLYRNLQAQHDDYVQKSQEDLKQKDIEISRLKQINDYLRDQVQDLSHVDFDNPDGKIQQVDHNSGIVWINLGEEDSLPLRTTFSVYQKAHHGVGQPTTISDIKASIEVVRVIGPHMAEARIVQDNITNPIAPGDPIFSPLWSPGMTYQFSFIGKLDIDNDTTDDRALVKDVVTAAGSSIDNIVDMDGNRTGKGITVHTKFLVIGDIPDPSTYPPQEREKAEKIQQHLRDMREEARLNGVRIISLSDFVSFMGLHTQRRMWRPGEQRPFNLKTGTKSPATTLDNSSRESSGQTSPLYSGPRSQQLQQKNTTGQPSKYFGKGN